MQTDENQALLTQEKGDSLDAYFECITSCSWVGGEDIECVTKCVEVHLKADSQS